MTRAVRAALAASLAALALGASGAAFAANCKTPTVMMAPCALAATDATPVLDLTLVHDAVLPAGHGAFIMPLAISETAVGDVVIDNVDPISEVNIYYSATAISGYSSGGSVSITNHVTGSLEAVSLYGNATGIEGYAYGDVGINNAGDTYTFAVYGNAIGLYGYSMTGDVSIDNSAAVTAISYYGLADGIFASGTNVDVSNTGDISATSVYGNWAAGIEAQGTDLTTVTNGGGIYAYTGVAGAHAYGIYATGDVVEVTNTAGINAQGYYATGIEAQGGSSVTITNDGDIVAGSVYTSALATGINATSNYAGGAITITNNGSVTGEGYYGGTGIAATATGTGGSASVTNNGSIHASQSSRNGYGAYGIVASADGDAMIDNNLTGSITVVSAGNATGAAALSFAGDTSVINAGDISADGYLGASGIVSFAQNGSAYANNSGIINARSAYTGVGIDVGGMQGATAVNSGDIAVDGYRAFGIRANSGTGDVSVTNDGSIYATYGSYYGYTGRAYGVLATSTQGDVLVDNSGDIYTTVNGQSVGIFASSTNGNVGVSNSGTMTVYSYGSTAAGIFARADYGMVTADNSGSISAESYNGNAFGILARGNYVQVSNSGDIAANGYASAIGVSASSYYDTTVTNTGGSIYAIAVGRATGIDATSAHGAVSVTNASAIDAVGIVLGATGIQGYAYGNVDINNSGDIYAGSLYGNAIGIYGYSIAGDVSIGNSGHITATSYYGLADGIFASGADVDVTNAGLIEVAGFTWAAGIEAQGTGTTTVHNSGDIFAYSGAAGAHAYGIYATGDTVQIENSAGIEAQGYIATGIEAQGGSSVTITNDGDIVAGSITTYYNPYTYTTTVYGSQLATGINANSNFADGAITITNNGDVSAVGYSGGTGIAATATGTNGSASVTNTGSVYASQYSKYGYGAYGIVASADGDATVSNSSTGSITVNSAGAASGATALSFAGNSSVTNAGDISVESTALLNYTASGIVSFAQNGAAFAGNSGSVSAVAGYTAKAVDASGFTGSTVINSGSLYASAKYAYGVYASSGTGDVSVTNSAAGMIEAYSYAGRGFGVFGLATQGDVMVNNAGLIEVYGYGQSAGVFGVALAGDTSVTNSGDITAISGGNVAVGAFARADNGTAMVTNSGDILASDVGVNGFNGTAAYGVLARGAYSKVSNSGSIVADGNYYATGIAARSDYGTTVTTSASSQIAASALLVAIGIEGRSEYGNVVVANAGSIMVDGVYGGAVGIQAYSGYGNVVTGNTGHIVATSEYGQAIGESGYSLLGSTTVNNSGTIDATGYYGGYGIVAQAGAGSVSVTNSGHITATSPDTAYAILASAYGNVTINNSGNVLAVADGDYASVAAVQMGSLHGTATLNNSGTLSVAAPLEGQVAVLGSNSVDIINNSGTIHGAVITLGGDDIFNNNNHGMWIVDNYSTDFGGGNDTINNNVGGTIALQDGGIYMGGGTTNAFNNLGTIKVNGYGLVDMGAGNTVALNNAGLISFVDGVTDDSMTIFGNLGGTGVINIDVDPDNSAADQIYIEGNMTAGAMQHVNIALDSMPTTAHSSAAFAHVSGTSVAGNFVAGQVLGYNSAPNFLDLGLTVTSQLSASNMASDVFSINVDVNGLNDTGSLAASVASGAAGMLNSQIGSLRQRLGVNPYGDAGKVMSAFVRFYTSEGDVSPTHMAANFGQGGNFAYDFTTWGREVGANANLFDGFHAGVTIGTADGRQRLTGTGVGLNRMNGMTWGAYATWFAPQGFYVDLSGRWMAVDVNSMSATGNLQSRAHTAATNLEAGYPWTSASGFVITPQLQYTRTKVDGIKTFFGDRANFEGHGGTSSRARLGVEFSKAFQTSGGMSITPYGAINAVREIDGKMAYTVSNTFFGTTNTKGTSAMVDLGVGFQKGGWGVTAGANWMDGGAYKSVTGGQVQVRFAW
ncbi:hypothetical protein [Thermomonas sp.]|uniref:hypothetical protein n=1 Tax=Thermomonas sp. TaxID=1971895 RepID=UPI0024890BA8|nr:hypothetical protein [Thermomonas sp.]MDI1252301.1 hypothetical protein [Thermomonas sp.]